MQFLKKLILDRKWLVFSFLLIIFSWGLSTLELSVPAAMADSDTPCKGRFQSQDSMYAYSPLYATRNFENTSYLLANTIISGETIQYWIEPNSNSDEVKVILNTSESVTFRKELALGFYNTGKMLTSDFTQGDKHTATITTNQSGKLCLQLSKAKTFGTTTSAYFNNLFYMKGKTIHIDWMTD